ncbi:MAG: hypothetical protein KKC85_13595, partial [Gammaproteobacteria bacterium]|nr:hypothetical protein [Gammaproteobacteria bacterium]
MDPSSHLKPIPGGGGGDGPVTEADLHAFADGQLAETRRAQIELFLRDRPAERQRVADWRAQNEALRQWLDPVVSEPLPLRLPLSSAAHGWHRGPWRAMAAGVLIAVASAGSAWWLRGAVDDGAGPLASWVAPSSSAADGSGVAGANTLRGFAYRAAVAHAVYSPDA